MKAPGGDAGEGSIVKNVTKIFAILELPDVILEHPLKVVAIVDKAA